MKTRMGCAIIRTMLFAELKKSLEKPTAPAYEFRGSDNFLIEKGIALVLSSAKVDPMNVMQLEESAKEKEINIALGNISMFGGATAVLTRGLSGAMLYLTPVKTKAKDIISVDCNPMTESLVVRLITQDKRFTFDAATAIARACENNYGRVAGEVEKLVLYYDTKSQITLDDVNAVITKTEKFQSYELGGALLKRDKAKAEAILNYLSLSGADDYMVFGGLVSVARRLFYITNAKAADSDLAKHLDVKPFAIFSTKRDARDIKPESAKRIYRTALELELGIKSGKLLAGRAAILLVGEFLR